MTDRSHRWSVPTRRRALLVGAALIAGAGVAYELSLMLLGTVTVGATEQANAVVLGTAMFGMGLGAAFGGRLRGDPVRNFIVIESTLAVLGAGAAPGLYWTWSRLDAFWGPLLAVAVAIGMCIGAEMPLLAAMNDRLKRQDATTVVAEYTAADYFGALVGAVAFAFLLRPRLGIVDGTILVAAANLAVALGVGLLFPRRDRLDVARRFAGPTVAAVLLVAIAAGAPTVVDDGRQALFRDPIVASVDSERQQIVVTERVYPSGTRDARLFLDGDLQLSSLDEYRYHESLVHPAVSGAQTVLILGGGDCLAVREVLRHRSVESVTLVELDPEVVDVMTDTDALADLGAKACEDPRVTVIHDDAFRWLRGGADGGRFDAVIADFPDPDTVALGRLYSVELYGMIADLLTASGRLVVQCGSPFFALEAYWTCAATLEEAGWQITSYHVDVPSFGDWGFHLATRGAPPALALDQALDLRFLTPEVLAASSVFAPDVAREAVTVRASTILDPSIVDAAQGAWLGY